ncbi:HNH endonuclease signature motif containing protein [Microlunatus speluncae]|uniref:HNH endonuclease signature motif containing protein n=1 Tax=Microlunatus speluncae TaxID=2594267 RepID=UPI0013759213|nr:HNH endonuclease signature motif containing protein [Microlunatus speluncae]
MDSGTTTDTTPVEHALGSVEVAVAELITVLRQGGLDHHDQAGLLMLLDRAETVRKQWQAVDAEILAVCRDRGIAERECQRSMAKVLERRCLINPGEARQRVKAAEAVGPRETPTGMPLPRLRDQVGAAMVAGAIAAQQVALVSDTLEQLDQAGIDPDLVGQVETELVEHCRQYGPKELKQLCQKYLDTYDPDGPEPNEQRNAERRSWRMHVTPSGAVVGEFRLTPETGAKAQAIFSSLADLRADTTSRTANTTAGGKVAKDPRSHGQRMHDAFDDLCSRLLRAGGLPDSGGTPATVIVTIDQIDLLNDLAEAGLFKPTNATAGFGAPFSGTCPTCGHQPEPSQTAPFGAGDHDPNQTQTRAQDQERKQGQQRDPVARSQDLQPDQAARDLEQERAPGRQERAEQGEQERAEQGEQERAEQGEQEQGEQEQAEQGEQEQGERGVREEAPVRSLSLSKGRPDDPAPSKRSRTEDHPACPSTSSGNEHTHPGQPGRVRRSRPRHGITSHGIHLTVPELLRLAGEAEIYPVVLTTHGKLVDFGRTRRVANKHQTLALIARDGGCSFPGCQHPPEWCERHHILPWHQNGLTNLRNLTLLCSYHHRHFLDCGWQVRLNDDGLPEWIPPRYLDPDQTPMINNRILARIHQVPLIT